MMMCDLSNPGWLEPRKIKIKIKVLYCIPAVFLDTTQIRIPIITHYSIVQRSNLVQGDKAIANLI